MINLANKEKKTITGNEMLNAAISFLVIAIVYFPFILPFTLWKKSVFCLSNLYSNIGILKAIDQSSYSFFMWVQFFMDALTFVSYLAGPVLIIIWTSNHGLPGFIKSFILFYFLPVIFHLFKELIMVLTKSPSQNNEKSNSFCN
jgi:hypothetical protein